MEQQSEHLVFRIKNVFNVLFTMVFVMFCTFWYIKFYKGKRRLHELAAKIPGTPSLPFIGSLHLFVTHIHDVPVVATQLQQKYKSPFKLWLGPGELVIFVNQPDQIQTVLFSSKALTKSVVYEYMRCWMGNGMITAPVEIWKRHKKVILPTFHQNILNTYVDTFVEKNNILIEKLRKETGKEYFNIYDYISPCTLDIICESMMGVNLNIQNEQTEFSEMLDLFRFTAAQRMFRPWLHNDFICKLTGLQKKVDKVTNYIDTFSLNLIRKKKMLFEDFTMLETESEVNISKRKGLLDMLLNLPKTDINLTEREIMDEVNTMVTAANETTATAIGALCVILGYRRDIQEKVYKEIIEVLGDNNRPITGEDLPMLEYTERVIKETMRMFPPVPLIGRQTSEELKVGDYLLPEGCTITIWVNYVHMNPELWPEPHKFDPDRFLPEEVAKRHPYSYIPFVGGPRICLGYKYAMMSMKVMVASLIRNYRLSCDYKLEDVKFGYGLVTKPTDGYKVKILNRIS